MYRVTIKSFELIMVKDIHSLLELEFLQEWAGKTVTVSNYAIVQDDVTFVYEGKHVFLNHNCIKTAERVN
jgi:hypothetical protein